MTFEFVQEKNVDANSGKRGYPHHVVPLGITILLIIFSDMPISPESFTDSSIDPQDKGLLHRPAAPTGDGLAPLLVALAEAFAGAGITVLRCDLPYRQSRPFGPPRPGDAARDREGLKNALAALRKLVQLRMFLGGHSYGGRQSTMLCADQPGLVEGLLLLSYPLHPPRKPDQLRTQHLPSLQTPALFVHGTRDPFGSPEEMELALRLIPAKTRLLQIEGGGHDLGFKGKATRDELPAAVLAEFRGFFL